MSSFLPFGELRCDGSESIGGVRVTTRSPGGHPERFCFPPLEDAPRAASEEAEPPAPRFSEAELSDALAAARAEAIAETEARMRADLAASLEQRQAEALRALCGQLGEARAAFEGMLEQRAGASRELALALARALVPRALARAPLADIAAMLRDVMARLERYPRLELRLPPELVAQGCLLLDRVAEETGYPGELAVSPDATLGRGDARLCWQDGAAVRDLAEIEAEALELVDVWLPPGRPDDQHPTDSGATKIVPLRPALSKGGKS